MTGRENASAGRTILGISAFYHDSAACALRDGRVVAAAQEERFSRRKHDHRYPTEAIRYCLEVLDVPGERLDLVVFYDKPLLKFERLLMTYLQYAPRGVASFVKAMSLWMKQKLWIEDRIRKELKYSGRILFPEHHESHAASAFFPSPFEEAAILTMDGVGEWSTTSYGRGKGNRVELMGEVSFPHSLGLLYSAFTYYTGFKVNSGEYKVMGLAPYGRPTYKQLILDHLIDLKEDGSFKLDMSYFNYCAGLTMTGPRFHELLGGPPRKPESELTQREMDLARSVQEVTEEVVLRMARHVERETGARYLCLAGGVALNCVANGALLREGLFDEIWIQPAAGDAGGALGAALIGWHHYLGEPREPCEGRDAQRGSYLGPEFDDDEIGAFLHKEGIPHRPLDPERVAATTAELLAEGNVIGWFQGRMEFGPRALGSRSIIGDARSGDMQRRMNLKIKFRESFRPFAPTVLAEHVSEWFELDRASPYMLLVADVAADKRRELREEERALTGLDKLDVVRSEVPAVTHVDFSARVQTAHAETNPLYHEMIDAFRRRSGCPVIINTSFNVRGEPIVCTPRDAVRCFLRTEMDYLVIGRYLLDKAEQRPPENDDRRDDFELD
ncbi:MAG: carbamoyltransferase [Polyangia bacterium]